jgi:hypothetical protein
VVTAAQDAQRIEVKRGIFPPAGGLRLIFGGQVFESQRVDLGVQDQRDLTRLNQGQRQAVGRRSGPVG